jgi:signal-transduction protein with cAMP-binding, CBS, and nucleotidyltransferase domain/DNA polymerase III epsilon subunit-like protein
MSRPGSAAPLAALDVVVLNAKTTGLDVRRDRIVQIAAVRAGPAGVNEAGAFERIVDPGVPIPEDASRLHGLNDAHVFGKPSFGAIAAELTAFMGSAVVVGHSINFDAAILRFEAARHGVPWREPELLDFGLLAAGVVHEMVDTSLDAFAACLGVPVTRRQTAPGDALLAAHIWRAMQPRLREHGVHSLGEALAAARRPVELLARQEKAGWLDRPAATPDFTQAGLSHGARKALDGFLYRHRLRDVMASPPIGIASSATLGEAARLMTERGIGCVVVDAERPTPGILTERDVLRALGRAGREAGMRKVANAMSVPVISAPADTLLYRALGRMARSNLRYLGVTDAGGRLVGIFTLRTLLRQRALVSLTVGDEIATARDAAGLGRAWAALPGLAEDLLASGFAPAEVAAVVSAETCAMTARAAELAESEMAAEGLGLAPAPYALLALGSAGRGESLLAPDQDNALVVADAYSGDLGAPEDWFTTLGARINAILDASGIPLCRGGVMAGTRAWRRRLGEWRARIAAWANPAHPDAVANVDIFHDFVCVHASCAEGARLARVLEQAALTSAREAPGLLRVLGDAAAARRAPVGLFGRLRRDGDGRADLKEGGLLPIVAGARVMALRHGIETRATPARLRAAAAAAGRCEREADRLAEAHGLLVGLILAQQAADLAAGRAASGRVDLGRLDRAETERLRDALACIEAMGPVMRDVLGEI